jgi:type I restriction enzyme S subunit
MKSEMAVSQHFIVWQAKESVLSNWFLYYKLQILKPEFERIAIGSTIKTIGLPYFKKLKLRIPNYKEQQKIASFLSAVDEKIHQLTRKKELLEQYKKGVMQQLFCLHYDSSDSGDGHDGLSNQGNQKNHSKSQFRQLRFKDENGKAYPKWEERKLGDVLDEHKMKSTGKEEVFSVSVHKGLVNQVEHLGRVFAAKNTDNYNLVKPGDLVYTKSPTGDFPLGIIKQSKLNKSVIVSPLYGVFTPETLGLGYLLHVYFESPINVTNYLASIIQKGAKNTINITNTNFLSKKMKLPVSKEEQQKIASFLSAIDTKIENVATQIEKTKTFKKGLLQQMFV